MSASEEDPVTRVPFSFELYPPRSAATDDALHDDPPPRRRRAGVPLRHLRRRFDRWPLSRRAPPHPCHDRRRASRPPHLRGQHLHRCCAPHPRVSRRGHPQLSRLRGDPPADRPAGSRSSATWRAPHSPCSSSTGCRPSARPTRNRPYPACQEPYGWVHGGMSTSPSPPSLNGHPRSAYSSQHVEALLAKRRRRARHSRSRSCSSTPTTTSPSSNARAAPA